MNMYKGKLFKKSIDIFELGNTEKAQEEFSEIEHILIKRFNVSPNISHEINRFKTKHKDNIMAIQCRYFLAGIDRDIKGVILPYAAHVETTVDVTGGFKRIKVKYNPELNPIIFLETLEKMYGESKKEPTNIDVWKIIKYVIYEEKLFYKNIEKHELGNTEFAEKEFSEIENILVNKFKASPNISHEINRFKTNHEDNIMSIQCKYFLARIDRDTEGVSLPYAAHVATTVDVTGGFKRIKIKYNPYIKPAKLLETLTEMYGPPKNISI